ncbi:MAG: hypothetical protein WCJ56_07515 [bacterium]
MMKRMIVACMLLLVLVSSALMAQDVKGNVQLAQLSDQIFHNGKDVSTPDKIKVGIEIVRKDDKISVADELMLARSIVSYEVVSKTGTVDSDILFKVLYARHEKDTDAMHEVLDFQLTVYSTTSPYEKQLADVVVKFSEIDKIVQNKAIVLRLKQQLKLAEAYIKLSNDTPGEMRDKAIECYNVVIDFPIVSVFSANDTSTYEELMKLYVDAAVGIVKATPVSELKSLRFRDFAFPTIEKYCSGKEAYINRQDPGLYKFRSTAVKWLSAKIGDMDPKTVNAELKKHYEAVLEDAKRLLEVRYY